MSGVLKRNRRLSEFEFFNTARAINTEVMKLMASESAVPKRYRFLIGVPTAETARNMLANINRADSFYPNSSFNVQQRKMYLTLAIADCEQLCLDFQTMIDMNLPMTARRVEDLVELIEKEIKLLKGTRKNVRIVGSQALEDRIDEAERELSRLIDLKAEQSEQDGL